MQRDVLFIIKAPFEDEGQKWFCRDCATMEGALLANPHWANHIDVRRLPYPRPRHEIIALLGEENQSMPVLVLASKAPEDAKQAEGGRAFLTDPKAITRYLAAAYGGAGPHP
jgi:hypothetical protein